MDNDRIELDTNAQKMLRHLFGIAGDRLWEREIMLEYHNSAITWLMDQAEWPKESDVLNRLNLRNSLNRLWDLHVANVIEVMMLKNRLNSGDELLVEAGTTSKEPSLRFTVRSSSQRDGSD